MHKATWGDCGNECEIPIEARNDKPVYCNDCFQNHKPERSERRDNRGGGRFGGRGAGGYGRNNRDGSRFGGGRGRDDRPREMHKATCGDCGNECEIPFKPRNARPVYCYDCFKHHKHKSIESREHKIDQTD